MPLPAFSHLSSQQILFNTPFWGEKIEQRAKQVIYQGHNWSRSLSHRCIYSHSRDWSRFFLKLCFSLPCGVWIINYNRALCTSEVPGLQGSISVGDEGGAGVVPSSGKLLMWLSLPKENEGPRGTERGSAMMQKEKQAPRGPVWNLYWRLPCKVFGLAVLHLF